MGDFSINLSKQNINGTMSDNQLKLLSLSGNFVSNLSEYFTQFLLTKNCAKALEDHSKK